MARSSSNRKSASDRASSVLPTPVGPRNRNEPMGRWGSDRPARLRRMALATAVTASSWPMTRSCSTSSRRTSLAISPSMRRLTGHAGPLGDDLGDVLLVDLFLEHALAVRLQLVEAARGLVDLALELGDAAVADLGRLLEVGLALGLGPQRLELLLELADLVDGLLLVVPVGQHRVALLAQVGQLLVEAGQALRRDARRSPWPAPPARSRAGGCGARRRRSRWASSRSRCAGVDAASSTRSMALSGRNRPVR